MLTERVSDRPFTSEDTDEPWQRARRFLLWHFTMADGMDEVTRRTRVTLLTRSIDPGEAGAAARELASDYIRDFGLDLTGPDAELRQALLISQQIGLLLLRDMMRLPELADAPREKLIWYLTPAVHQLFAPHRAFPELP